MAKTNNEKIKVAKLEEKVNFIIDTLSDIKGDLKINNKTTVQLEQIMTNHLQTHKRDILVLGAVITAMATIVSAAIGVIA